MIEATYRNIRKLFCGVFFRKQTLPFASATMPCCDVLTYLLFHGRFYFCLRGELWNSLGPLNIDEMNADHFKLLSCKVETYEFLTMSTVIGQTAKFTNPSYTAGWPDDHPAYWFFSPTGSYFRRWHNWLTSTIFYENSYFTYEHPNLSW